MRLPADIVELKAENRTDLLIQVRLGDGDVKVSGGVGGWDAVGRPLRTPMTVWKGIASPLTMTLPLLFDGFGEGASGTSVEADIAKLEAMGGLDLSKNAPADPEPPLLVVEGSIPHDASREPDNRWVIATDGLEWGSAIKRRSDGHRVRQSVLVTLWLFQEDDRLESIASGKAKPSYETVKSTKKLNTYEKLAAHHLKNKAFGGRLARLNGQSTSAATKKLKEGTKVRLPTPSALQDWRRGR